MSDCDKFSDSSKLFGFKPSGESTSDYVPTMCSFHYAGNKLFQEAASCDFPNNKSPPTYAVGFMDAIGDLSPIGACYYNKDTNIVVQKMDTPNPMHGWIRSGKPQEGVSYDHPDITFMGGGEMQFACCGPRSGWSGQYEKVGTKFNQDVPLGNNNKEYGNATAYCHRYCQDVKCPVPEPTPTPTPTKGEEFHCVYLDNNNNGKPCSCDNMGTGKGPCNVNSNWNNAPWTFQDITDQKSCEKISGTSRVKWCPKGVPVNSTIENFQNDNSTKQWNCPGVQSQSSGISGGGTTGGGILNSQGSNPKLFNFGSGKTTDCENWFEGNPYAIDTCKTTLPKMQQIQNATEWTPVICPNALTKVTGIQNDNWQKGFYPSSSNFIGSSDESKITQPDGKTKLTNSEWQNIRTKYGISNNTKLSDQPVVSGAPIKNSSCRDPSQNKPCVVTVNNADKGLKLKAGTAYSNDGCRNPNSMYSGAQGKYTYLELSDTDGVYAQNTGSGTSEVENSPGGLVCYIGPGVNQEDGPWSQRSNQNLKFADKFLPNSDTTVQEAINSSNVIPYTNDSKWDSTYKSLLGSKTKLDPNLISDKYGCY